jgi:tetratricopeptide (TPR) repeat protein
MKKKLAAKVKRSGANHKKNKVNKQKSGRVVKMAIPIQAKVSPVQDPRFAQAVDNYQAGLKAMQEHKFDKARTLLQKVVTAGLRELADRAAVHLSTCNQHMERAANVFKTAEEHYDYSVSLMNLGDYVSAREHLEKILKQAPKADYAWYGLSVLNCLTGHFEDSLKHLIEAIRLNPANRFQARNDSDFQNLADDPRFTELIYPELEERPKMPGDRP